MVSRSLILAAALLTSGNVFAQTAANCELPNVLVLLDISGTMNAKVGTKSKMAIAVDAIDGMLTPTEAKAKFGLSLFPSPGAGNGACTTSSDAAVSFKVRALSEFRSVLKAGGASYFGGAQGNYDTPIQQGLESANALFPNDGRRAFVILVTDGKQDCCFAGDGIAETNHTACPLTNGINSTADSATASEQARYDIAQLVGQMKADRNITVFPIGFTAGSDAKTLNLIAQAAGTEKNDGCDPEGTVAGAPNNCYYHADDEDQLLAALNGIVQKIQTEVCDGLDNDCDGKVDEGEDNLTHLAQTCAMPACGAGVQSCTAVNGSGQEAWGTCTSLQPKSDEVCNNIDDDCDGKVDEDLVRDCGNCLGAGTMTCNKGKWSVCSAPTLTSQAQCEPAPVPKAVEPAPAPVPQATPAPVVEEVPAKRIVVKGGCDCQNTPAAEGIGATLAMLALVMIPRLRRRNALFY